MSTTAGDLAILQRSNGQADNGEVTIDDFDRGVIETLGATALRYLTSSRAVERFAYFWQLDSIRPPPGMPGIPVIFATGEDTYERYKIPYVKIVPSGMTPAMNRWHPGMIEFRAPARSAREVQVGTLRGRDRYVEKTQAHPFDFTYTIMCMTKRRSMPTTADRGPGSPRIPVVEGGSSNMLLTEVLRVYPAYCGVNVLDSARDYRTYTAFMEGISPADEVTEVGDRTTGFSITLRVEGELDLDPVTQRPAVTRRATFSGEVR